MKITRHLSWQNTPLPCRSRYADRPFIHPFMYIQSTAKLESRHVWVKPRFLFAHSSTMEFITLYGGATRDAIISIQQHILLRPLLIITIPTFHFKEVTSFFFVQSKKKVEIIS
jgi:hypothetical protein